MNFTQKLNRLIGLLDAGLITQEIYNQEVNSVFCQESAKLVNNDL